MNLVEAARDFASSPILSERLDDHPRIFLTRSEIGALRDRAYGPHRADWLSVQSDAVSHPSLFSRPQPEISALCYVISQDDFYLGVAREQMSRLMVIRNWAGAPYDPSENKDLAMGHGLTSLSLAYDFLYDCLRPEESQSVRDHLARNCRLTYDYYTSADRKWQYAQNHAYLPMVGMALAAYALYDNEPEAEEWLRLCDAFLARTLQANGADGWYYEGWGYWSWAVQYLGIYAEARFQMTGDMDALSAPLLRLLPIYVRYMLLPGGRDAFDFGDSYPMYIPHFERLDRENIRPYSPDYYFSSTPWRQVVHLSGGRQGFQTHPGDFCPVQLVDLMAARFLDGRAQQLSEYLRAFGHRGQGLFWSLLWKDPTLAPTNAGDLSLGHHFEDHEIATWRSGWGENATAVAVKCGPPMGHSNARNLQSMGDLQLGGWHTHPDAGSFILFTRGEYMCTDTGYTQPKSTLEHNSLLINGRGQDRDPYRGYGDTPYSQLNSISLEDVDIRPGYMYARANLLAAYPPDLDMERIERRFLVTEGCMLIWDVLEAPYPHDYVWLLHADTDFEPLGDGYQTRNGDVSLQVRFLQTEKPAVQVHRTVVLAHQHVPRGSGPPQERGMHLEAHRRGSACQYVACLTWGWGHETIPDLSYSLDGDLLSVSWQRNDQRMELRMTSHYGSVA